jgi:WD40 repeat protein
MHLTAALELESYCLAALFIGETAAFALADGSLHRCDGSTHATSVHDGLLAAVPTRDGKAVATGGEDGRVCKVDMQGTVVQLAHVARKWITTVAAGPDNTLAFASGRAVWLLDAQGTARTFEHKSAAEGVEFSPDGSRLAVARYNAVSLHPVAGAGAAVELEWKAMNTGVTFSPDGRFVVARMRESGLHGWRLSDAQHMRMLGYAAGVSSWSWGAGGNWLATSGAPAAILWPFEGEDGPMGRSPLELGEREASIVSAVAFHPFRRHLAIGYADGVIQTAEVDEPCDVVVRSGGRGSITSLGWNSTGARLAFGSEQGECGVLVAES